MLATVWVSCASGAVCVCSWVGLVFMFVSPLAQLLCSHRANRPYQRYGPLGGRCETAMLTEVDAAPGHHVQEAESFRVLAETSIATRGQRGDPGGPASASRRDNVRPGVADDR